MATHCGIIEYQIKSSRFIGLFQLISKLKWNQKKIDCVFILVVTGSTDGIGKEYAKQLAQHGVNVVLIARNESKLVQISREIGKLSRIIARILDN